MMKRLVSTRGLDHASWLQYRKKGLGGSDAGAACGVNRYRSAMQVFLDKTTGQTEEMDNEAMRQGRELEDYVARRFMEATGKKVRRLNAILYDDRHPFMLADVDRMVVGENAGLECKTASPYSADQWKDGKIPPSYLLQCYHYMSVCQADAWYLAVVIYGKEFRYCKIERDEEAIQNLVKAEKRFWKEHVLKGVLPDPDGSEGADSAICRMFPQSSEKTLLLPDQMEEKLLRRQSIQAQIDQMDAQKRKIEQELKLYLGNAGSAENERFRISWKTVSSSRLDEKRLKEEEPELYQKFRKTSSSRRFTVKAA